VTRSDAAAGRLSSYVFPLELRVDELLLRVPTEDDVETIAPAFLDPTVGGEAGLPAVDAATLKGMLRELLPGMFERGLLCPYVIEDVPSGELVGGATLHHFDPMRDAVEVGYWLFGSARGRGIATRTVRALGEHAFANGIVRYEAYVRTGNTASERVLERVGFAREGVKRRYLRHGNMRVDATLFALLADDA
jgi:RimJ/RimL family protein N-acetyltransferase